MVVLLLYSSSCMLLTRHSSISMREFSVTPGQFSVTFFPASTTISPTMESGNRDIVRPSRRGRYRENKKQRKLTLSVDCEDLHDRAASGPFRQRSDKTSFLSTLSTLDDSYDRDQSSRVVSKFQHFACSAVYWCDTVTLTKLSTDNGFMLLKVISHRVSSCKLTMRRSLHFQYFLFIHFSIRMCILHGYEHFGETYFVVLDIF